MRTPLVGAGELDRDPWLLNVLNGTIDLHTGQVRDHRRDDLITKLAPIEFQPDAPCEKWIDVLAGIFRGCNDLVDFLRRLAGYFLTGSVRDHVLPIFYGTGANGKSTTINTLQAMLGPDYSMKAAPDLLMLKRGDAHPTERADLFGKRFVACLETEQARRLAESMVKDLTGGDYIRARRMREDHWEFTPTQKIILATNHKPVVRGTDPAIWRRLLLVPFTVTIPPEEQDQDLPEKLAGELPGILAWAVCGCLDWQRRGVDPPPEVQAATADYRHEQDVLGEFLHKCCLVAPEFRITAGDLFNAYVEWTGDKRITKRALGLALRERGFVDARATGGARCWEGIGLVASAD